MRDVLDEQDASGCESIRAKVIELGGGKSQEWEVSPDQETAGGRRLDGDPLPTGEELSRLMARFGQLLEQHEPGDVVVVPRAEWERRETAAYAAGWQDAAEEYRAHIAAARWEGWLGRWRPLRAVDGPGEVIPFPSERLPAEPDEAATADTDEAGGTDPSSAPDGDGPGHDVRVPPQAEGLRPAPGTPQRAARPRTPSVKPSLSPKSRRSKSPTIPRLAPLPRRRRPAGDSPEGTAD